mgnify:CR=1 FL=1
MEAEARSGQLACPLTAGPSLGFRLAPRKKPTPQNIPITKEQLVGVLDPMTAAFLLAHSDKSDGDLKVCDQTIPVFDGDWRFDLVLTPKRRVQIQKEASTGYSGYAAVCQVRFKPISGYRPDDPNIKLHVPQRRDRGLARFSAGDRDVCTLSDCVPDGCRFRLSDIDLIPRRRGSTSESQTLYLIPKAEERRKYRCLREVAAQRARRRGVIAYLRYWHSADSSRPSAGAAPTTGAQK